MSLSPTTVLPDLAATGSLHASINLGNPVLAQGTPEAPAGVTVDITEELGRRLGVPVELHCFDAARKSFEALASGETSLAFLAIEPAREAEIAFSPPYLVIEGVYLVPASSPLDAPGDVDREGFRIGVKEGSAYDLFLSRTLQHATVVRGTDGVSVFHQAGLEVAAGIRQPVVEFATRHPEYRVIEERFMQIRQAVGISRHAAAETVRFLADFVEELKTSGFIAESLRRSGQDADLAANGV
ncbi:transporter substrate-binding domain-containing protein [Psychromicrobium sp. YIM B11713]|uniref:transporter substrate-binding domain-containing protein n=1 Tax=Psychromicrobium sp. YIM B11713 TaxID=3145233 RepID=UPI00374F8DB1